MNKRIAQLRKELNLRQREFAEKVGVSTGAVGSWESGSTVPGDARIGVICSVFNVRREWLEHGEGEMYESPNKRFVDDMMAMYNSLPEDKRQMWHDVVKAIVAADGNLQKMVCNVENVYKNANVSNVNGHVTVNQ